MAVVFPYPLPSTGFPQAPYVQADLDVLRIAVDAINASIVTSITGTANQVIASASTGAVTLSLPQSIATSSTPTFAGLTLSGLTATTVPYLDASKAFTSSAVTPTELGYLSGVSSAIQTQLGLKATDALVVHLAGSETLTGTKTITIGTTNATTYTPLRFGLTAGAIETEVQRTTGITSSAVTILQMNNDTGFVVVNGTDGTNTFIDLLLCSSNSVAPTVVSSRSAVGSPAARTYTASGFAQKVSLASGTYRVVAYGLELSIN